LTTATSHIGSTILIPPGGTAHVGFVADNPGKWPIDSAIPEHRPAG
jgi:hypothetical protein